MTFNDYSVAISNGDMAFLDAHADDPAMANVLHLAAHRNRSDVIAHFLEQGRDIDAQFEFNGQNTPLMAAAGNRYGSLEALRFLLERGANPHLHNAQGQTAMELAEEARHFSGKLPHVEALREFGVEPSLAYLVEHDPAAAKALLSDPAFSPLDRLGRSAAPALVRRRMDDLAKSLVERFGVVDVPDREGITPLHAAILRKSVKLVQEFLRFGANPNPVGGPFFDETPLILAITTRAYVLLPILLEGGADTNLADIYGMTPIVHAVRTGSSKPVALLLAYGADPRLGRNLMGQDEGPEKGDALTTARQMGKREIARLLEGWAPPAA